MAARPKAWFRGRSLFGIAVSKSAEDMDVCCRLCVLSGRGICDGPAPHPEESNALVCVCVCVISCKNTYIK